MKKSSMAAPVGACSSAISLPPVLGDPPTLRGMLCPVSSPDRTHARALAADAVAAGDAVGWFETLYAHAAAGDAVVPWADLEPNPFLVPVVDALPVPPGGRAIVVGCGYGDDAAHLAGLGWDVTAFDVSPTSVEAAAQRFPRSGITWEVCDVLQPFRGWIGAFDLVVEVYTVQVLPPGFAERARSIEAIASLVAPGGRLVVVARARDDGAAAGDFPWPLTRGEVESFATGGLDPLSIELDIDRSEGDPVGRWVAVFGQH
jgi:SAM-dependent methyltransferase